MNPLLRCHQACERNVRHIGLDSRGSPPPISRNVGVTMRRDQAKGLSVTKEEIAKLRFANARGLLQHCSEHRLKIARGAAEITWSTSEVAVCCSSASVRSSVR